MRIGYKIEEIASYILEMLGYQILDRRRRIVKDEEEIGEVDIIAKRNGEMYAVEVKSGTISVSDIRQAYMNALFLGFKPLIIGRGISDEAAAITARELGVKYILLPEYILMRLTDL
ncbi:MAG: endonuclease, partial [Thermoprotei archaeon]